MDRLQPVRGMHDWLPDASRQYRSVMQLAEQAAARFGYAHVDTPILEATSLFARSLGDETDVVQKEMYTFEDKGGEYLTLRPEGTAPLARLLISAGLDRGGGVHKFYYQGPMFRRERPQKGRLRQFHQVGVECFGSESPIVDAEVIACGQEILEGLGLGDCVHLKLNSLGDPQSRAAYRETLLVYLRPRRGELSEMSRQRLDQNPLRILDSKDEGDRKILVDAPTFPDSLSPAAQARFQKVLEALSRLEVPFQVDPHLVRGFDYYRHTAFEFLADGLGAQATVLAGGRYDGLVSVLGGADQPGIGFAAGVERLALLREVPREATVPIHVIPLAEGVERDAFTLTHRLRRAGLAVDYAFLGNASKRLKRAARMGARFGVLVDEQGGLVLRRLADGQQSRVGTFRGGQKTGGEGNEDRLVRQLRDALLQPEMPSVTPNDLSLTSQNLNKG